MNNYNNQNDQNGQNNQFKKETSLDEIKKKLYSPYYKPNHPRAKLAKKNYDLEKKWDWEGDVDIEKFDTEDEYWGPFSQNDQKKSKSPKNFFILILFALLFFIGSLGYAFYTFNYKQIASGPDAVTISVFGPVSIGGGETLSLDVIVQNNYSQPLELVDLVLDYPEGTKNAFNLGTDLRRDRMEIPDIKPGEIRRTTVASALFGDENTVKNINITLEYRLKGSNAIFKRSHEFAVTLSASPVRLTVEGLKEISSGQELELTAHVSSNSTRELKDVMVIANYPFGFTFEEASIRPYLDNNIWFFETLKPEEEHKIIIKGKIQGQDNEDRVFRFSTGIKSDKAKDEIALVWGTTIHETNIRNTFATLAVKLGSTFDEKITVKSGEFIEGSLIYTNNTNDTIRNVIVDLRFEGEALNKRSVKASTGFYSSSQNRIFWDKDTEPKLESLKPGQRVELLFRFASVDLSDGAAKINDPVIRINTSSEAVRITSNNTEEKFTNQVASEVAVLSDIGARIYTAYGENPITNQGPLPPKADQKTTYTVILEVSNGNNDLKNAKLVTRFPSYVDWERVASPEGSRISYNDSTKEMTWNIGDIESGVGYETEPKKLFLAVTLTPSLSQVGQAVDLTMNSRFEAFDTVANEQISSGVGEATTIIFTRSQFDGHALVVE